MGCAGSKHEGNDALFLCRERVRFMKQAMDSRFALSAAQLSYMQSLRNVGIALRQFAECETAVESSSCASPSPSRIPEHVGSPRNGGSPSSPRASNLSYMRATAGSPLKFTVNSSSSHYVEEESLTFPFPPPPPPPPDSGSSWDYFDPIDASGIDKVSNGASGINQTFSRLVGLNDAKVEAMAPLIEEEAKDYRWAKANGNGNCFERESEFDDGSSRTKTEKANGNEYVEVLPRKSSTELSGSKKEKDDIDKEVSAAMEDASKLVSHRAKDFVSSVKDIENLFAKAAESGHEVSRMLETKKIRLNISSEIIGKSSAFVFHLVFCPGCCKAWNTAEDGITPNMTKVITWNRSISSRSSSSRNPLTSAPRDDCAESCSDFIEEFCMISGSHSSTLDRLYAWERKLYDEVKASESIRKAYDQKCAQLRHQFAKDMNARVIDKTRATVKDLHSRVRVTIQAVDSISRRIERLRDDELQPQLLELIQGLMRMWNAMLECHHAQNITISLAYHAKSPTASHQSESYRQAISHLQTEIECFISSFVNWVNAQKSYVKALNSWLKKCILPPQEKSWRRKGPFSPRRALAPPIFVLVGNWLDGVNTLPSKEVIDSLKDLISNLHGLFQQQREMKLEDKKADQAEVNGERQQDEKVEEKRESSFNLVSLQTALTSLFDRLIKFSEASAKVYENVKGGTEQANDEYVNGVRFRFNQGFDALPS